MSRTRRGRSFDHSAREPTSFDPPKALVSAGARDDPSAHHLIETGPLETTQTPARLKARLRECQFVRNGITKPKNQRRLLWRVSTTPSAYYLRCSWVALLRARLRVACRLRGALTKPEEGAKEDGVANGPRQFPLKIYNVRESNHDGTNSTDKY